MSEPIMWITKNGKHIPIYADQPTEDEQRKEKNIADNEREGSEKNKPVLEPLKPTKNADEAFRYIYRNARTLVKRDANANIDIIAGGFNYKGDETPVLSVQALRGIQSKINSERADLKLDVELGVLSKDEVVIMSKALDIVQRTLNDKAKNR